MAVRAICTSVRCRAARRSTSRRAGISSLGRRAGRPDGRFIYFTAAIGGESHLFRASVPDGRVEQVTHGARRLDGALLSTRRMTKIAYTVGVHDAPAGGVRRQYRRHRTSAASRTSTRTSPPTIAFSPAERLQWPSKDGTRIEGWLLSPYGYDRAKGPYPMIVLSHGGPHAATGYTIDFKAQYFAANGYFVLRHELPKLHRLRRGVQVGDLGRLGRQGRRGRHLRDRLRAQAVPDRSEARRATPATRTAAS